MSFSPTIGGNVAVPPLIDSSASFLNVSLSGPIVMQPPSSLSDGIATLSGGTLHGLIPPTDPTDAASKQYVDSLISVPSSWKIPAIAATTTNITLSGSQTIDGVSLNNLDRVLVKNQLNGLENGIYNANTTGTWNRSFDMSLGYQAAANALFVESGTVNAGNGFICTNVTGSDTVGTNALLFTTFNGSGNGNITGPVSSTNTALALWNGTSGTVLKNSVVTLSPTGALYGFESLGFNSSVTIIPYSASTIYTLILPPDQGSTNTFLKNDGTGALSWSALGAGDVVGPASATNNALALFDTTTGKTIKNSLVTLSSIGVMSGARGFDLSGTTSGTVSLIPTPITTSYTLTLPSSQGASNTYLRNNGSGTLTWSTPGNVTGPVSSTDTALALFSGTSGSTLQNSVITVTSGGAIAGVASLALKGTTNSIHILPSPSTSTYSITMPSTQGAVNTYLQNNGSGTLTWATAIAGPPSSTDTAIATFNGSGGSTLQNSVVTLSSIGSMAGIRTISFSGSTSGSVLISVPAITTPYTLQLPSAQGTSNTYLQNDGSGVLSWAPAVSGPVSSTDTALALFNGTSGKLLSNSSVLVSSLGALTGVSTLSASSTITGGSLTDGTFITTSGNLTGVRSLQTAGSVSGTVTLTPSATTSSYTLVLPPSQGATSTYLQNNGSGTLAWTTAGNIYGPASSTNTALALYGDTTGKLLTNSVVLVGSGGAITGVSTLTASSTITGGSLTDGTMVINSGSIAGARSIQVTGSTSGTVTVSPAATTTSYSLILPALQGSAGTFLKNNGSGSLSWELTTGNISGPVTSTNTAIALYSGTAGNILQNSVVLVSASGAVTGVQTLTASSTISGGTLTDGTLSTTAGAITGARSLQVQGSTSGTVTITPAAVTTSYSIVLPSLQGSAGTYLRNNGSGTLTWDTPGNVSGPATSTNTALALYGDTTGKLIQNSVILVSSSGTVTGVQALTASSTVTAATLTDGTLSTTSGVVTGIKSLQVNGSASGNVTISPYSTTSNYSLVLPAGQGSASTYLMNDGSGNLTWNSAVGGISGTVQYNNGGVLAGNTGFTYNSSTTTLTVSGKVTGLNAPTDTTDAANKQYVDNAIAGLAWKQAVNAATTTNITLSGTQTVDTVSLVAGNRILAKNQTNGVENGIYIVAAGAWSRSSDLTLGSGASGASTYVLSGSSNGQYSFVCNNFSPSDIVGTNALTFVIFNYTSNVGNVVGPLSSTDSALALYDGASGKLLKNSAVTVTSTGDIAYIKSLSLSGTTSGTVILQPAATTASYALIMPSGQGLVGTYLRNDGSGTLSWASAGTGTVGGPATSTDTAIALYNGTGGNTLSNSVVLVSSSGVVTGVNSLTASSTITGGTLTDGTLTTTAGAVSGVRSLQLRDSTTGTVTITLATSTTAYSLTLPSTQGSASTYLQNDGSGLLSWVTAGNVSGPGSSTDTAVATYNGTGGKTLQNSLVLISSSGGITGARSLQVQGATSGTITLTPAATTTTYSLILPSAQGAASTYLQNNGSGTLSWATAGNVTGPGGSTDTALALFNGTAGSTLQNSVVTLSSGGAMAGVASLALKGTTNSLNISPAAGTSAYSLTMPSAQGAASTYLQNNGSGTLTWATAGNVSGPGSSTDTALALFNGTAGSTLQNSVVLVSSVGVMSGIASLALKGTTNSVNISPAAATSAYSLTMPSAQGAASTYLQNNGSGTLTWATAGNVSGPVSSTDTALALFNGTAGSTLQNSVVLVSSVGVMSGIASLALKGTTNSITISPAAATSAYSLTMPSAQGAASTYLQNNGSGTLSWATAGNVTGPGSSTDTSLALFNGTAGTTIKNSVVTLSSIGAMAGVASLALKGTTNSLTISPAAATAAYSLTMPSAQGTAGTVLTNNGSGTLTWSSSSSASPGGSTGSIQYNNSGSFGGATNTTFTYTDSTYSPSLNVCSPSGINTFTIQGVNTPTFVPGTSITIQSGQGSNSNGGNVNIIASQGDNGGGVYITSGSDGFGNTGSYITCNGGGGGVLISTGSGNSQTGGDIVISGNSSDMGGGNIILTSGIANVSGSCGNVIITASVGTATTTAGVIQLSQNDVVYNWPTVSAVPSVGGTLTISGVTGNVATMSWASSVLGPSTSTVTALTRWNSTTGTVLNDSIVTLSDLGELAELSSIAIKGTTNSVIIRALTTTNAYSLILPGAQGAANTYLQNNGSGTLSWATAGNVTGPGSSTDTALALFNGTAGSTLQNSVVLVSSVGAMTGVASLALKGTTNSLTISPSASTSSYSLTMPPAQGAASTYLQNNGAGTLTWATPGNVTGPVSSTDTALALFSGTDGLTLQNSVVTLSSGGVMAGVKTMTMSGATSGTISIVPGATTTTYSLTLPSAQGAASTVLTNNGSGTLTWSAAGNVTGPGSSTDTALALFSGTGGKTLQNSVVLVSSTGAVTGVNSLQLKGTSTSSCTLTAYSGTGTQFTLILPSDLPSGASTTQRTALVCTDYTTGAMDWLPNTVYGPGLSTAGSIATFSGTNGVGITGSSVAIDNSNNITGVLSVTFAGGGGSLKLNSNPTSVYTLTLPPTAGSTGQYLYTTNSTGTLGWTTLNPGNVNGPGSSTDTALALYSGTGGKTLQNSVVLVSSVGNMSGLASIALKGALSTLSVTISPAINTGTYSLTLPSSSPSLGQILVTTDSSGTLGWTANNTGNVIGAPSSTDNALALFSGTGGKTLQNSVVTLSSAGAMSGVASLALKGTTNSLTISPAAATSAYSLTMPSAQGAASTVLTNNGIGTLSWTAAGNVVGAASSTDTALALFSGTGGKTLQNSVVTVSSTGSMAGIQVIAMNGSTSGTLTILPAGVTTTYTVILPSAQGAASTVLTNNGSGTLSWATAGNVTGAASSTDTAIALYSGTGGKTLQNSVVTVSSVGAIAGAASVSLKGTTNSVTISPAAATNAYPLTLPAAQGAASTLLRNDGSGGLSWYSIANTGKLLNIQVLTTGTAATYTPTANTLQAVVYCTGGGGGGGGNANISGSVSLGAGGYCGATRVGVFTITSGQTGLYTIGAAGAGNSGAAGGAGGNSTFNFNGGNAITGTGGPGGTITTSATAPAFVRNSTALSGGSGTVGGNLIASYTLQYQIYGTIGWMQSTTFGMSGNGSDSIHGGAGLGNVVTAAGTQASGTGALVNSGSGGGGSIKTATSVASGSGGAGGSGLIIVYEYG